MLIIFYSDTAFGVIINGENFVDIVKLKLFISEIFDDPVCIYFNRECGGGFLDDFDINGLHSVNFHKVGMMLIFLFQESELSMQNVLSELNHCLMDVAYIQVLGNKSRLVHG